MLTDGLFVYLFSLSLSRSGRARERERAGDGLDHHRPFFRWQSKSISSTTRWISVIDVRRMYQVLHEQAASTVGMSCTREDSRRLARCIRSYQK